MMLLLLMMLQFKTTVLKELCPLSELSLDGDYLLGGLFELYESNNDSDILESSMLEIPVCNR